MPDTPPNNPARKDICPGKMSIPDYCISPQANKQIGNKLKRQYIKIEAVIKSERKCRTSHRNLINTLYDLSGRVRKKVW